MRVLFLGTTIDEATVRFRVDLPNSFSAEIGAHCA